MAFDQNGTIYTVWDTRTKGWRWEGDIGDLLKYERRTNLSVRAERRHFAPGRVVVACGLILTIFLTSCAQWAAPVPAISEHQRAEFGTVGVMSVNFRPEDEFSTPLRGRIAGGAAGAGAGALEGFLGALRTGSPMGLIIGTIVFVPVGAVVGAIAGAVTAVPESTAKAIEERIIEILTSTEPQEYLRQQVIRAASEEATISILDLTDAEPQWVDEPFDYKTVGESGIDTVLEVGVLKLGFAGTGGADPELVLFLQAHVRLIRTADGAEIYVQKSLVHQSVRRKFTEWGADDGRLVTEDLNRGYRELAQKIVDRVFLEVW